MPTNEGLRKGTKEMSLARKVLEPNKFVIRS
jgi:hypothetical protein